MGFPTSTKNDTSHAIRMALSLPETVVLSSSRSLINHRSLWRICPPRPLNCCNVYQVSNAPALECYYAFRPRTTVYCRSSFIQLLLLRGFMNDTLGCLQRGQS